MASLIPVQAVNISSDVTLNITGDLSMTCNLTDNPWCGQFGAQQVIEIIILITISIVGTFGNLLVITSITCLGRQYKNGNIFLVNLAFADLLVTAICFPTYIANVFKGGNALPDDSCKFIGYLMLSSAICSLTNLACIAINRYWAVVRFATYPKVFTKRNMRLMVLCCWIYANLLTAPGVWSGIGMHYDKDSMVCMWNRTVSAPYNCCLSIISILVPSIALGIFYLKLYKYVHVKGKALRMSCLQMARGRMEQRSIEKEIAVLKTLAITAIVFYCLWIPAGVMVTISKRETPIAVQKYTSWLCLSNSAVNFIIYGITNRDYRRLYVKFLKNMLFFKKDIFRSKSTTDTTALSGFLIDSKQPRIKLSVLCKQIPSIGNKKRETRSAEFELCKHRGKSPVTIAISRVL